MLALKYSISVFFFPLPPDLFIYLFSIPCEIGAVFDQSDEKASAYTDGEGGRENRQPPPRLPVIEVFYKWILASIRVPLTAQVKRKQ